MPFWDVGTTNKLVGAPISGDQSALTEMQSWLDAEAKRKREEEERKRLEKMMFDQGEAARNLLARARTATADEHVKKAKRIYQSFKPDANQDDLARVEELAKSGTIAFDAAGNPYGSREEMIMLGRKKAADDAEAALKATQSRINEIERGIENKEREKAKQYLKSVGYTDDNEIESLLDVAELSRETEAAIAERDGLKGTAGFTGASKRASDLSEALKIMSGGKERTAASQRAYAYEAGATRQSAQKAFDEQNLRDPTNERELQSDYIYRDQLSAALGEYAAIDPQGKMVNNEIKLELDRVSKRIEDREKRADQRIIGQDKNAASVLNSSTTWYGDAQKLAQKAEDDIKKRENDLVKLRIPVEVARIRAEVDWAINVLRGNNMLERQAMINRYGMDKTSALIQAFSENDAPAFEAIISRSPGAYGLEARTKSRASTENIGDIKFGFGSGSRSLTTATDPYVSEEDKKNLLGGQKKVKKIKKGGAKSKKAPKTGEKSDGMKKLESILKGDNSKETR